jgi:hypothetical protein
MTSDEIAPMTEEEWQALRKAPKLTREEAQALLDEALTADDDDPAIYGEDQEKLDYGN